MVSYNEQGNITVLNLGGSSFLFDGKGPRLFGCENGIEGALSVCEEKDCAAIHAKIENKSGKTAEGVRAGIYLGVDCYMEKFPDWNKRVFPTMLRCEKTHFYGYFMSPEGAILGVASPQPIASYKLLYNGEGHRIYSAELDMINSDKQPPRHNESLNKLCANDTLMCTIYLFKADNMEDFAKKAAFYTGGAPIISSLKYTFEIGEKICINADEADIKIVSPSGKKLDNGCEAGEYGVYSVYAEKNDKIAEGKIYCRREWAYYLKRAREEAINMPQKATTHCESWYGLFSGYLAAKHYPDAVLDKRIDDTFSEIMPYMFDLEKGEPIVIPERVQNTAVAISLFADRYEATHDEKSLDEADKLADYLIGKQHDDGAYYRGGTQHYTCVIYIAKSMLELYLAVKDLKGYEARAEKYYNSAKAAIDNLVRLADDIGTEGEQTFEDGMISCSALQIAMFALLLDESERKEYVRVAEYMIKKHECLEQKMIPDCRMRNGSLRYWEAQYDVQTKPNMMNSPHGWTAWTLYAKYYLYLLTGKQEYLTDLMDGMGACVQLISPEGELRWAFICDPCIEASVFVKDKKLKNGYSGKFVKETIGEQYLPMISGWFRHEEQKLTGGYLECPLYLKDETRHVDLQGGCCDNDVHEIFKCLEETVLKKAFIHECDDGKLLCYSCRLHDGKLLPNEDVDVIYYNLKNKLSADVNGKSVIMSGRGTITEI